MSCSDRDPVPPHFRGYPQFPLSLPSYLGPRVHATFPCCLCIRFFGPDCHRFRQWEHTPDKHHLMLKPAVQDTSVPVPWHSPILFFSQPHVSLSSQARYLPCPPPGAGLCHAPSPWTPSPLSGLSFMCKAASHTPRPKLPLSFFLPTGCLHPVSQTKSNPLCFVWA